MTKREMINIYLLFHTMVMLVVGLRVNAAGRGRNTSVIFEPHLMYTYLTPFTFGSPFPYKLFRVLYS